MKIGLDLHCVIDYDPVFFSKFSKAIINGGGEIHIMTGSSITPELEEELLKYGMMWTALFSIADYWKNKPGIDFWYDEKGRPWVDENLWNQAKGLYAQEKGLDLLMDDTLVYKNFCGPVSFAHCHIFNKSGKSRGPKAIMPPKPEGKEKTVN